MGLEGHRDRTGVRPGRVAGAGSTGAPGLGGTAVVNFGRLSNSGLKNNFSPDRHDTVESYGGRK